VPHKPQPLQLHGSPQLHVALPHLPLRRGASRHHVLLHACLAARHRQGEDVVAGFLHTQRLQQSVKIESWKQQEVE